MSVKVKKLIKYRKSKLKPDERQRRAKIKIKGRVGILTGSCSNFRTGVLNLLGDPSGRRAKLGKKSKKQDKQIWG